MLAFTMYYFKLQKVEPYNLLFMIAITCMLNEHIFYQTMKEMLTAAELKLFINGDPQAINFNAASLQEQVRSVMKIKC